MKKKIIRILFLYIVPSLSFALLEKRKKKNEMKCWVHSQAKTHFSGQCLIVFMGILPY